MSNTKVINPKNDRHFDVEVTGKWSNFKINQKIRNDKGELCIIKYKFRPDQAARSIVIRQLRR